MDGEAHCDLLSQDVKFQQEFEFQHNFQQVSLEAVFNEKASDLTYLHQEYIAKCLETEYVDVATDLAINLLGEKISSFEEKSDGTKTWSLVLGFPERMEQLIEFEKTVSMTHSLERF